MAAELNILVFPEDGFIRIGEISVLVLVGIFLISFGIAGVIESYFSILAGGFGYLAMGVVLLVMGMSLRI